MKEGHIFDKEAHWKREGRTFYIQINFFKCGGPVTKVGGELFKLGLIFF
jgi:hypothetical protein